MPLKFSKLGARQQGSDIARIMTLALERPDILSLAAGFTDTDTLPLAEVSEAVKRLDLDGDKAALQYGANRGRPILLDTLTARLSEQDARIERGYASELGFITNGSQQALYLAIQTLCDEGDIILVEQPTYFVFLEMLRGLGVEAVSMPMTDSGDVDVTGLESLLAEYSSAGRIDRVKAVYVVSYFANPSGHSVSLNCKKGLVEALSSFGGSIALIEDAAYRELYYETPFNSYSSLVAAEGSDVPVLYSTTLTKPFASGLKVGYGFCTNREWLDRMLAVKGQQDFGTAHLNQAILAQVIDNGVFDSHLAKIRASYLEKMDTLDRILQSQLSNSDWKWARPTGGLYLWLKAPEGVHTDFDSEFHSRCIESGVMYVPGDLCFANHSDRSHVRLSFGVLDLSNLAEAGIRFASAISVNLQS